MASPIGNGMCVITQYNPSGNAYPAEQSAQMVQTAGFLWRFIKGEPKALGVVQIMIGIMNILLGGILVATGYPPIAIICGVVFWGGILVVQIMIGIMNILLGGILVATGYPPIAIICGVVFWGGILFIISGSLSISAEKKVTDCLVKGSLAMNVISAVASGIEFIFCIIDLIISRDVYRSNCSYSYYNYYCVQTAFLIMLTGVLVLLLILSLLEMCISIATSAFGCKAVCHAGSEASQPMIAVQYSSSQDPRFHPTQNAGLLLGQGMPTAQGVPAGLGVPPSYNLSMAQGFPSAPKAARAPTPMAETPPSYYKNVNDVAHFP
ncbi:membrane-spanning 4-domains subfamily A member 4A-like isoform X1 [Ambystoma mexicanum]|uniref:membrane-spanning 4-domains subfamily A member 4A-like isoform X1 n=1 Tax=Ambystoma mexicanum TaxID=8296 RepID=UPI0037E7D435